MLFQIVFAENSISRKLTLPDGAVENGVAVLSVAEKYILNRFSASKISYITILLTLACLFLLPDLAVVTFIVGMGACVGYFLFWEKRYFALQYKFDDALAYEFPLLVTKFKALTSIPKVWHEVITKVSKKVDTVVRNDAFLGFAPPYFLKTASMQIPSFNSRAVSIFFLPDKIICCNQGRFSEHSYKEFSVQVKKINFIERNSVPTGAEIVGSEWEHSNKSGGPDKRYKTNKEYPVCLYDELIIKLDDQTFYFLLSKPGFASDFAKQLLSYKDIILTYKEADYAPAGVSKPSRKLVFNAKELSCIVLGALLMIEIDGQIDEREVSALAVFLEKHYDHTSTLPMNEFLEERIKEYQSEYKHGYFKSKIDRIMKGINLNSDQKEIAIDFYTKIMESNNNPSKSEKDAITHFLDIL